jgi:hypothetical protein
MSQDFTLRDLDGSDDKNFALFKDEDKILHNRTPKN